MQRYLNPMTDLLPFVEVKLKIELFFYDRIHNLAKKWSTDTEIQARYADMNAGIKEFLKNSTKVLR